MLLKPPAGKTARLAELDGLAKVAPLPRKRHIAEESRIHALRRMSGVSNEKEPLAVMEPTLPVPWDRYPRQDRTAGRGSDARDRVAVA